MFRSEVVGAKHLQAELGTIDTPYCKCLDRARGYR